jgi:hypothetical protein
VGHNEELAAVLGSRLVRAEIENGSVGNAQTLFSARAARSRRDGCCRSWRTRPSTSGIPLLI